MLFYTHIYIYIVKYEEHIYFNNAYLQNFGPKEKYIQFKEDAVFCYSNLLRKIIVIELKFSFKCNWYVNFSLVHP